jgi:type IV secretion system protein VirD4
MGFMDGLRRGRDAAIAAGGGRRRPAPHGGSGGETERPPSAPTPIKLGYYYDRKQDKTGAALLSDTERHCLIFGLNGAGKSTRFLIELLMTASNRSLFVFDIKGELAYQTADERRRLCGRQNVKIINPYRLHGMESDGFNPLAQLEPGPQLYDAAAAIGEALIEIEDGSGQYWSESAQGLLVALIMFEVIEANRERQPSLLHVREMLTEADEYKTVIDASGRPRQHLVKGMRLTAERMVACGNPKIASLAGRFTRAEGLNELASIKSTADTQTQWMLADAMTDLEKDGVDFRDLRRRPTTVFAVLPPEEISLKRKWTRVVLAAALTAHFKPGPVNTLFVLDEFRAAIGKLTIVNDMWSLVRGYGVQLMPIVQSALQLQALFKEEWENYAAQTGMVATLGPANDHFTAEWMSKRSGTTTILQRSLNFNEGISSGDNVNSGSGQSGGGMSSNQGQGSNSGRSQGASLSYQQVERRAVLPQEIMSLKLGHGFIWVPGEGSLAIPFFAPNYWKRSAPWVARVKSNPYRVGS